MLSIRLIRRLLERLCQVLTVLTRVATHKLPHFLLHSFRRFVTRIRSLPRRDKHLRSLESAPEFLTSASSGWCSPATLPLHHGHITSLTAENSIQDAVLSSQSPLTMPVPSIPQQASQSPPTMPVPSIPGSQQAVPPQTSLHNNPISSSNFRISLMPIGASDNSRYENRHYADKRLEYKGIPAFTREFPNKSCPWLDGAPDWDLCVHPEGALYLYNSNRKTFTEANMDETAFPLVDRCVDALYNKLHTESILNDDIELVLQVSQPEVDGAHASCQYYFVDHTHRTLFWLQEHVQAAEYIFAGLKGIYDLSHIGYALESEYWTHCERYPNHKQDRVKLIKELRELVMYASAEIITSDKSLSPFRDDELSSILGLIDHLEANAEDNNSFPHSTCVIARFMHYFSRAKFFNFCGLPCARLDADKSVYGEMAGSLHPLTSKLSLVFDAMLFWASQAHYNDLRRVWVDDCIVEPRWNDFSRNLMSEWNGITIYSTVMLAVDISFLAVPSVGSSHSFGIITTDLSIVFITGSLIASLLLARQTQRYGPESAEGAAQFLLKMTGTFFGTRALATVHSLPYAMLLWGMIFFATSFLYNVFKSTTTAMLASVVSGSVVVTMFILWFIWAAREVHIFTPLLRLVIDVLGGSRG